MELKKGMKIRNRYGQIEEISHVETGRIFTYENLSGWYHPSKIFPVYWSEELQRYVSAPEEVKNE